MKTMFILLLLALPAATFAQRVNDFFYNSGVQDIGAFAHPSNTIQRGSYNVQPGFVVVDIRYGSGFYTQVKVGRGFGSLYFNSLSVISDNDFIDPFLAFGLGSAWLAKLMQKANPQDYRSIRDAMIKLLGSNPENWDGTDWALFALNLDYLTYSGNK